MDISLKTQHCKSLLGRFIYEKLLFHIWFAVNVSNNCIASSSSVSSGCSLQWSLQQIIRLHLTLTSASSSLKPADFMSSFTTSMKLLSGLPLGRTAALQVSDVSLVSNEWITISLSCRSAQDHQRPNLLIQAGKHLRPAGQDWIFSPSIYTLCLSGFGSHVQQHQQRGPDLLLGGHWGVSEATQEI